MNKMMEMFDMDKIKQEIKNCPEDEVLILCSHWSINKPKYTDKECENETDIWDWYEMEDKMGHYMEINDYDDLIIDVHGIMENG